MQKLYKDILELKTWIREEEGAKAEGKGQFGKIHSEKQLLDLVYKFNTEKNKEINIIWLNGNVNVIDNKVIADAKVIITNGEETMEVSTQGLGEEKRSDISFGLGKALTYGKRFWLQKFLDLSSDDIDPEHVSNKPRTTTKPVVKQTTKKSLDDLETVSNVELATYKNGNPVKDKNGKQLTMEQYHKAVEIFNTVGTKIWDMDADKDLV